MFNDYEKSFFLQTLFQSYIPVFLSFFLVGGGFCFPFPHDLKCKYLVDWRKTDKVSESNLPSITSYFLAIFFSQFLLLVAVWFHFFFCFVFFQHACILCRKFTSWAMIPNRMSNRSSDYISYHKKRDYERRIPKDRNEAERHSSEQLAPFFYRHFNREKLYITNKSCCVSKHYTWWKLLLIWSLNTCS